MFLLYRRMLFAKGMLKQLSAAGARSALLTHAYSDKVSEILRVRGGRLRGRVKRDKLHEIPKAEILLRLILRREREPTVGAFDQHHANRPDVSVGKVRVTFDSLRLQNQ